LSGRDAISQLASQTRLDVAKTGSWIARRDRAAQLPVLDDDWAQAYSDRMAKRRSVADGIRLYGTLLGLTEAECEAMASGGSPQARRLCLRDLRRRYREENRVSPNRTMTGVEELAFWKERLPTTRFVYFIQQGNTGPVKIGIANDPRKRLGNLQTGNPAELHLRHVVPGDRDLENQLHHRFREARIRCEGLAMTPFMESRISSSSFSSGKDSPRSMWTACDCKVDFRQSSRDAT
jgi:hypothetical protein